jgi:hypothetical protein
VLLLFGVHDEKYCTNTGKWSTGGGGGGGDSHKIFRFSACEIYSLCVIAIPDFSHILRFFSNSIPFILLCPDFYSIFPDFISIFLDFSNFLDVL